MVPLNLPNMQGLSGRPASLVKPPTGSTSVITASSTTSGTSSTSSSGSQWTEHTTPEGKKYYHNKLTKKSVWEKPVELKTPQELLLSSSVWKECTAENGRKYYHN